MNDPNAGDAPEGAPRPEEPPKDAPAPADIAAGATADNVAQAAPEAVAPPAPPAQAPDRSLWVGVAITAASVVALYFLMNMKHDAPPVTTAAAAGPQWVGDVQSGLGQRGYDWVRIDVRDGVATVSGSAPDVDSRQYALEAAQTALLNADTAGTLKVVVDATELAGGAPGAGLAVKALSPAPAAAACQGAFQSVLASRPIAFTPDTAELTQDNTRLLDALAGVALRCKAYRFEIGGHTENSGAAAHDRQLSQARAAAVQGYLVGKGVAAASVTARGYGADKPLDAARTPAADARNRRIEVTVTGS